MQLLQRPRRNGAAPPVGKKISPGRRNQEPTSIAGTMRRRGMEEAEILAALRTTNERRCDPGPVPGGNATTPGEYTSLRKRPSVSSTGRPPIPKTKAETQGPSKAF